MKIKIKKIIEITTHDDNKISIIETKDGTLISSSETVKEIVEERYVISDKIRLELAFEPKIGITYLDSRLELYGGLDLVRIKEGLFLEMGFTRKSLHLGFSKIFFKAIYVSVGYGYKFSANGGFVYISSGIQL